MKTKIRYYKQNGEEYSFSKEPQIKITQTSNADMNIGIPKKQTAVDWLLEQLKNQGYLYDLDIEAAKEIEKERIIDFANKVLYNAECSFTGRAYLEKDINEFYKETYEK